MVKFLTALVALLVAGVLFLGHKMNLIEQDLQQAKKELQIAHSTVIEENEKLSENIGENVAKINTISEQISLLDESISPADKRWAKIKKVRSAVQDTIKNSGYKSYLDIQGLTSYSSAVVDFSEQYDVPMALILAVTRRESAFNPKAVSHAGAQGLMQLMPATAKECAQDVNKSFYNVFRVKDNVQLGTWYLWKMMNYFNGDVELAIRAYNAGPVYVKKVLAGELENYPSETIKYHEFVMEWKKEYEEMGF